MTFWIKRAQAALAACWKGPIYSFFAPTINQT